MTKEMKENSGETTGIEVRTRVQEDRIKRQVTGQVEYGWNTGCETWVVKRSLETSRARVLKGRNWKKKTKTQKNSIMELAKIKFQAACFSLLLKCIKVTMFLKYNKINFKHKYSNY